MSVLSFTVQIPLLVIATGFIFTFVRYQVPGQSRSKREMLKRIDYGGSVALIVAVRLRFFPSLQRIY